MAYRSNASLRQGRPQVLGRRLVEGPGGLQSRSPTASGIRGCLVIALPAGPPRVRFGSVGVLAGGVGAHGLDGAGGRVGDRGTGGKSGSFPRWTEPARPAPRCLSPGHRGGIAPCPEGLAGRPADCIWGGWSPLCTGAGRLSGRLGRGHGAVRPLRGKVRMMADVACFCGCVYSFDGHAGACPGCGEVATLTAGRAPAGAERGRREQSSPGSERARARRTAGDLGGMGAADPGSPSRHRDERQHVPGRDRRGEPTLAGEQRRLAQHTHSGAAQATARPGK